MKQRSPSWVSEVHTIPLWATSCQDCHMVCQPSPIFLSTCRRDPELKQVQSLLLCKRTRGLCLKPREGTRIPGGNSFCPIIYFSKSLGVQNTKVPRYPGEKLVLSAENNASLDICENIELGFKMQISHFIFDL